MFRKDRLSACIHALHRASYFLFFHLLVFPFCSSAQFTDSFPPGQALHQNWSGDIGHFLVSGAGELQLQAPAAGSSTLLRRFALPTDSLQIQVYFKLAFAPSTENALKLYLWTNHRDESKASGLYLSIGENGQQDAIHLWQMTQGVHRRIGSCRAGGVSQDPALARLSITLVPNQPGIITCDYTGGNWLEEELLFPYQQIPDSDSLWFGLKCIYTTSRKSNFFFDDISVISYTKDALPLKITQVRATDSHTLHLRFSELPDDRQVKKASCYFLDNGMGQPDSVIYPMAMPGQAALVFGKPMDSEHVYTLRVDNLPDVNGNQMLQHLPFVYAAVPTRGDLAISEILCHPETGGADFVEITNISARYCSLNHLSLSNAQTQPGVFLPSDLLLPPGGYAAFSKDVAFLKQRYAPPDSAVLYTLSLPSFPSTEGSVFLRLSNETNVITLDSLEYNEEMHSPAITRTQGVSLERMHFSVSGNPASAWHSASAPVGYATPGYKNSVQHKSKHDGESDSFLTISPEVISPNGDGKNDFASIAMHMPKPGFLATVFLADAEGYPVITLLNNVLLGIENQFIWDGQTDAGGPAQRGCYVLVSRVFHPDGDTFWARKPIAVVK